MTRASPTAWPAPASARLAAFARSITACVVATSAGLAGSASAVDAAVPTHGTASGDWTFRVLLDGKPIGQHHFRVSTLGDEREVRSDAEFTVKFLGITAYRYRHHAIERWRGDCLVALTSTTDDDGQRGSVQFDRDADPSALQTVSTGQAASTCVMSFAYWNPALRTQSRLLNAQTGKLEDVAITAGAAGQVDVRGQRIAATRLRIAGSAQPIDIWYSAQGDWLGLDSTVAGGRVLSYRLMPQ